MTTELTEAKDSNNSPPADKSRTNSSDLSMTPGQIVRELDKYIIGQDAAKKSVAIALRNRWRRMNADEAMRDEIMPNNIIMIGPTGVGKTEIARRLAKLAKAPFIKVEATKFTEVGYVGRDVEGMIRDLTDLAIKMVKDEQAERVKGVAKERAEERILDILIPPSGKTDQVSGPGFVLNRSDAAEEPKKQDAAFDMELRERTRNKFREKLRKGELDDREVDIDISSSNPSMMQVFGPNGMEEMGVNIQEMFGNMLGGKGNKKKKKRLKINEALEALTNEEAQKMLDPDSVNKEAIERVESAGIVFIDEIDKVAGTSQSKGGPDVSRQGVQRDLLPIVEGSTITTKYGLVKTDHVLFVASGAFHVSKPSDLIPELQGRFPIRVELNSLNEEDFYRILTEPQNALIKQYQALFNSEGVKLSFEDEAIRDVARIATQVNAEIENIGARRLHTILTTLLEEFLFSIPDDNDQDEIVITSKMVSNRLDSLLEDRDLSQYIL